MMMLKFVFPLLAVVLTSCTLRRSPPPPEKRPSRPVPIKVAPSTPDKKIQGGSEVLLSLISPESVTLDLLNLENQEERQIDLTLKPETFPMPKGQWQVMAFSVNNVRYEAVLTSQNFSFNVNKPGLIYGGSLLVQCPKLVDHRQVLKRMKFFNRYHFSAVNELCELVVGHDFPRAKSAWMKAHPKSKSKKFSMGF